jgi:putative ABC transport system permease protein
MAIRMVVQLILVGLVLRRIFASNHPLITVAVVAVMLVAASHEVGARGSRRLSGRWQLIIGPISVTAATVSIVLIVLTTTLRPVPWYDARHALPLVGIVLETVMNAASLALNSLLTAATRDRLAIEARLALGSTKNVRSRPSSNRRSAPASRRPSTRWQQPA